MKLDKARVGIADYEEQKARLLAIARGEYRPKKGEPRIWFTSIESFSQVLSSKNQELLNLIIEARPKSINELAALSGRKQGNLSRTLKTLERYGLVRLKRQGRVIAPQALYDRFELDFAVTPPTF